MKCHRPIEGRKFCDQLLYYVYQTATGENVHRLATVVRRDGRREMLGRCEYKPFPEGEPGVQLPHGREAFYQPSLKQGFKLLISNDGSL